MAANCEKVVSDLFAAWTRLDLDGIMGYFAEDAVWDNVPMSPAKGRAAIREMTHGFLKDTATFSAKILRSAHDGNVVFNERVDAPRLSEAGAGSVPAPASSAQKAYISPGPDRSYARPCRARRRSKRRPRT